MQNKSWNAKLKSLLHSLDIDTTSNIDEIKKFGESPEQIKKRLNSIYTNYKKNDDKEDGKIDKLFDDNAIFDESDPEFSEMLERFFRELNTGDPLTDAVLMWFQELVIVNDGKFKIIKNEDGTLSIIFNTDEYTENGKTISITNDLLNIVNKINNNEIIYKKLKSDETENLNKKPVNKKPVAKKAVAKKAVTKKPIQTKNERTEKKQTTSKKNTKNKDSE